MWRKALARRAFAQQAPEASQAGKTLHMKGITLLGRPAYLDVQATSPLDPRVLDAMMPWMTHQYGNPHSSTHAWGWEASDAVEVARGQVADIIGASEKEIVFTSGATESNNLAIKGIAEFYGSAASRKPRRHIITTQIEHKCVLDSCRSLEQQGFEVTYLKPDKYGIVTPEQVEEAMRDDTVLVSVMLVNNEIGVMQDVKRIGRLCRDRKVFFHTDAAQAVGKIPIDVNDMCIDLMSISGHKLYGPKGIGALYVRRRPRVRLRPLISGGGQERGLRSGTLAAPLCVGMGKACQVSQECMQEDEAHVSRLAARLQDKIRAELDDVFLNGHPEHRYCGNVNLSFAYVEGESLLMGLKNVAVSSGSACTSASLEPSYVLRALGVSDELAHTSIRYGIGRFTTEAEIDLAVHETVDSVKRLREMSPLWEMVQDGIDISAIQWEQH
ncbi:MAG: cysteine desulfurase [Cercozoa sp. M6MM]